MEPIVSPVHLGLMTYVWFLQEVSLGRLQGLCQALGW